MCESDGWRVFGSAPKDGSYILALVGELSEDHRWRHLSGRAFVIRHEGETSPGGYDMGWAMFPGFGGVSDNWFSHWMSLPPSPTNLMEDS